MKTNLILATLITAGMAMAQVTIPEGTKVRVRLEESLSSETAAVGQTVAFAVTQDLRVGDTVVLAAGAAATGTVVEAQAKRRMGRAGKLDFSIDRVQLVDGNWMDVRYTQQKNKGKGAGLKTGVLTAGLAVFFLPVAPLGLLVKGHDVEVPEGRAYDVFADLNTYVATAPPAAPAMMPTMPAATALPVENTSIPAAAPEQPLAAVEVSPGVKATVSITANQAGADIEVDGIFVGNAPTTIPMNAGMHHVTVRLGSSQWQRDIRIIGGSVSINATLSGTANQ